MDEHDPMCPSLHVEPHLQETLMVYSVCKCDLIARVRADEREAMRLYYGIRTHFNDT